MAAGKFTTTPSPIEVVEKVNAVIDDVAGKLSTSGTAAKATADASGNTITSTYATKTELTNGLNGKLSTSGTAAKATADASGNNIANTYATKAQAVTNLTASGKTVTFTKADGSTGTFTTQDTTYSLPTASASTLGGIKVGSGLSISNGVLSSSGGSAAVSAYKIPYATCSTATSTAAKVATITNGVDFSLATGSICIVTFSTKLFRGSSYATVITLNINSTGAKQIQVGGRTYFSSWNPVRSANITVTQRHETSATQLFLYNGSVYYVYMPGVAEYDDYADTDN